MQQRITCLPSELLFEIRRWLSSPTDFISLSSTCRSLFCELVEYHDKKILWKLAVERGNSEFVGRLLDSGRLSPNFESNLPLREACRLGHLDIVAQLLKVPEVDPNDTVFFTEEGDEDGEEEWSDGPLDNACSEGHLQIIKLLLQGRLSFRKRSE